MAFSARSEVVNGKKRIIFVRVATGVDKTREAVLKAMGPGWEYKKKEVTA